MIFLLKTFIKINGGPILFLLVDMMVLLYLEIPINGNLKLNLVKNP